MADSAGRPPVWQMVKQAVDELGSPTTNVAVRDWVLGEYPGTNRTTIACQIIVCTVNHDSRIHYPQNQKVRAADGPMDFLFRSGHGQLELYDSGRHGAWGIAETEDGRLTVGLVGEPGGGEERPPRPEPGGTFAMEAHLRDYVAANLARIEDGLDLYADENGNSGVEYGTPVGRIDILATDHNGDFVVVELKVSRGADAACGQILRYKGWVRQHVADGKKVRGIIIANRITDRIKYAVGEVEGVELMEYALDVTLKRVGPDAGG